MSKKKIVISLVVILIIFLSISKLKFSDNVKDIKYKYFGNEVKVDLDENGSEDSVYIVTEQPGGSGTFYYLVATLNTANGKVNSEPFFLGDRIAPQTTEVTKDNVIIVNYADRKADESFATPPSVGISKPLVLDIKTMKFMPAAENPEGEADPSVMKLNMKTWNWVRTEYNDERIVTPKVPNKFTLTFDNDKNFSVGTDCNRMGGEYMVDKNTITFSNMISTEMYCEVSQEQDFAKMLTDISSYHFTSKGELILDIKFDSGVVIFR